MLTCALCAASSVKRVVRTVCLLSTQKVYEFRNRLAQHVVMDSGIAMLPLKMALCVSGSVRVDQCVGL